MPNDVAYNYSLGWTTEDFWESTAPSVALDDPWGDPLALHKAHEGFVDKDPDAPVQVSPFEIDSTESDDEYQSEAEEPDDPNPLSLEFLSEEHNPELAIVQEWETHSQNHLWHGELEALDNTDIDEWTIDDPEPQIEFDDDLHKPVYEPISSDTNLSRRIVIDQLLAEVAEISRSERETVISHLLSFSAPRFSIWYNWMHTKQWTGKSLLLFLRFQEYWDNNCDLWERLHWSRGRRVWAYVLNRHNLSLEDSYALVKRRSHCDPEEIIDQEWIEDWDSLDTWVKIEQGFFTLASFAMYRSALHYAEDWRRRPDLGVDFETTPMPPERHGEGFRMRVDRFGPRSWLMNQNWHDPTEWHDGLGWD